MTETETTLGGVEVREVSTEYAETGVGVENRTDVEYQLGAEVNGEWVPFASVSKTRAEVLARASADRKAAEEAAAGSDTSAGA